MNRRAGLHVLTRRCSLLPALFGTSIDFCLMRWPRLTPCRGLIGPQRQFGKGSIYYPFLYALIIGAFLPFPFWFWQRRYPNSWTKYVSTPVLLNGVSFIPPATGINYSSWFVVGFVFQYLIRKRNFSWWNRFNYVTSAALDCGTVISLMVIFFTLQVSSLSFSLDWGWD